MRFGVVLSLLPVTPGPVAMKAIHSAHQSTTVAMSPHESGAQPVSTCILRVSWNTLHIALIAPPEGGVGRDDPLPNTFRYSAMVSESGD